MGLDVLDVLGDVELAVELDVLGDVELAVGLDVLEGVEMSSSQLCSMLHVLLMHVAGGPSIRLSTGTLSRRHDVHLGVLISCGVGVGELH